MPTINKDKYLKNFVIPLLCIVLLLFIVLYVNAQEEYVKNQTMLISSYENAYNKVENSIYQIDMIFSRMKLIKNLKDNLPLLIEIYKLANEAEENLDTLPYNHTVIENISKYLTQVSDYSHDLAMKGLYDYELTQEDKEQIEKFMNYSSKLYNDLKRIRVDIEDGNAIEWNKLKDDYDDLKNKKENEKEANNNASNKKSNNATNIYGSLRSTQEDFKDYADINYDGMYSDHIEKEKSKFLTNQKEVNVEEAKEIIKNFFSKDLTYKDIEEVTIKNAEEIKSYNENDNIIPFYEFEVKFKDEEKATTTMAVTKQGGIVAWMLHERDTTDTKNITIEKAKEIAQKFLKENGFSNMYPKYYEVTNSDATINFNYMIDDINVYGDLVKVKVSLEDGEILGIDAINYIKVHDEFKQQTINSGEIKISEDEVKDMFVKEFAIEKINLSLVTLDSTKEVLAYEVIGNYNDKSFAIYVNTEKGNIEQIDEIIDNEYGNAVRVS